LWYNILAIYLFSW